MNLFGTVLGFAGFFKSREFGSARIDNVPFRLHYSFTSGFLFLATALLGLNELFGKEIQCYGNRDGPSAPAPGAINQFCWVSGTYTVPGSEGPGSNLINIGPEPRYCTTPSKNTIQISPDGLVNYSKTTPEGTVGCKVTQSYYQWVPFILMFQGLLFLLPHRLWTELEEGKMESITEGVRMGTSITSDYKDRQTIVLNIARFIHKQSHSAGHRKYAYGFLFCLVLSLANVIFNFYFLDLILVGKFRNLGLRWIGTNFDMTGTLLITIFPRMTACVWNNFGSGGGLESTEFVCILAANIITEKIFVFLWFWYIVLTLISGLCVVYYSVLVLSTSETARHYFLQYAVKSKKVRRETEAMREEEKVEKFLRKLAPSNFFFLYFLAHNVEYGILKEILRALATLDSHPPTYGSMLRSRSISVLPSAPSTPMGDIPGFKQEVRESVPGRKRMSLALLRQGSIASNLTEMGGGLDVEFSPDRKPQQTVV